jgi:2-methylisocitrate lyase-like PEP mutase family enzyme
MSERQKRAVETYRELHAKGCFVLPNPWDAGGAVFLEHAGFRAVATTSAGMAFARALADSVTAVPRDAMLAHIAELAAATSLPVNADFQSGYADDLEGLAANVRACVATGVAGLSIEDATGEAARPLYGRDDAIARVKAARAAVDATGTGVVLTARCEAFLVRDPDAEKLVLDRLVAFAEAGADCLYAPGVRDEATISAIVRAVAPKPVNVLVSAPGGLTVARLDELGVRRVSVGSALARVAWGAFMRASRNILERGTFDDFADAASFAELDALFGRGGTR